MIKEGMIVRYAHNWCSEEERRCLMVVKEAYDDIKRCKIQHLNSKLFIQPTEVVDFEMIVPTGFTVDDCLE